MKTFTMNYLELRPVVLRFIVPWLLMMLATAIALYPMHDKEFDGFVFADIVTVFIVLYFLVFLVFYFRYREVPCQIIIERNTMTVKLLRKSYLYPYTEERYTGSQIKSITLLRERREVFYQIRTHDRTFKVRTRSKWYELSGRDDDFSNAVKAARGI